MKRVEVLLGKDGSVKVEASGFKGNSCVDATQFIRKALGAKTTNDNTSLKSEYWEEENDLNVNGLPSGHCG